MSGGATWRQLALEARRHRDQSLRNLHVPIPTIDAQHLPLNVIDEPGKYLTPEEVDITETPLPALIEALQNASLTATMAVKAFLRRAAVAQQLTNCVTELVPDEALARAVELDDYLAQNKRPIGPLHGLPVSIKAHMAWKGLGQNAGIVVPLSETCDEDAPILRIIRQLGAIPFVRTTMSQALMTTECCSNAHGSTVNPHNIALTSGGSSGGEGALLALRGSPLGIGADLGGSLRAPAANCGIFTLKPTTGRLPFRGLMHYLAGSECILPTPGPMSASIEGINLFMKHFLDTQPWLTEPSLVHMPWREYKDPFGPTINVGVMWDDGFVKPSKSMNRALQEVVEKLETNPRFKVLRWEPYETAEGLKILEKLYSPDGGDALQRSLARLGEPYLDLVSFRARTGPGVESLTLQDVWNWTIQREGFRLNYLQEWNMKAPDMHVILCPPQHGPAQPPGTTNYWGYASIFNLLEYPTAVFPVTRVDPELDQEEENYSYRNEFDAWAHKHYDAKKQQGAPVGLQLVGRKMEDEKVVLAMQEICWAAGLMDQ